MNFVKKFLSQDYLGLPGQFLDVKKMLGIKMGWVGMRDENGNLFCFFRLFY